MLTKTFEAVLLFTPWVTVLAVLLLAARRWLLQNRQAARALRLAWLVLAARCAVPVRLTLPRLAASRPEPPAWSAPVLVQPERVPGIPLRLDTAAAASPPPATGPSLSELLIILWALGALCFVAVQLTRHLVFCRQLCRCRVRLPLWGRIYRSPGARVPVTIGLLRPAVYLPVSLAPDDLPFVLAHERHHIRAGDLWFQLLLLAAQALHWFNPVVHRMALAARQDMERACDAAVLQNKPLPYRLRYGETVLAALKNARRQAALSAPLCGPGRAAQTRFKEMLDMRTPKKSLLALPALLCAAVLACSLFTACTTQPESSSLAGSDPAAFSTEHGASAPESASVPGDLSVPEPQSNPSTFDSDTDASGPAAGSGEPAAANTGFAWPVPSSYRISRGFYVGKEEGEQSHKGVDILGEYETPIYAIQDGTIVAAGCSNGEGTEDVAAQWAYGIHVTMDHGDGLQSVYAHLSGVAVEKGDTVEKGQLIGYMGSSGRSTGTHLHWEVLQDGSRFNPYILFSNGKVPEIEEKQNSKDPSAASGTEP